MTTHFICQNSMTGAIHVLPIGNYFSSKYRFTPCGYYVDQNEVWRNPDLKKKKIKVCIKCHKSLKKSHKKDLMAYVSFLKLSGQHISVGEYPNGRIKI